MKLVAGLKPEGHRRLARVCFPNTSIIDAERLVREAVAQALGRTTTASAPTNVTRT